MKTLKFSNLIDSNTGKTLELEVPEDFDESNPTYVAAGKRGAEFGARHRAVSNHLRNVESMEEIRQLGRASGERISNVFGTNNGE